MDYEVIWTRRAGADFQGIIEHISCDDPAAAERVAAAIVRRVDLLQTVPLMGAVYPPGPKTGRYRVIVSGKYRIFYRVKETEQQVEILTVWHSARQEPDLPAD